MWLAVYSNYINRYILAVLPALFCYVLMVFGHHRGPNVVFFALMLFLLGVYYN